MKNNITRNITLDKNEKILKNFKGLKAKGCLAQFLLTDRRLVLLTYGLSLTRGRKTKQRKMNEIELKSIHRFEYYVEYINHRFLLRLLGLLIFLGSAYAVYLIYAGQLTIPEYPYSYYLNYAGAGLLMLIGLSFMFKVKKTLHLKIKSGLEEKTSLALKANKYNELALRYLASKIHLN
ncbi:MAG: hypothetical protein KJ971_07230 [Firmicutes bacterium]|nr:hypothetical protein [Bacillota bacterium]